MIGRIKAIWIAWKYHGWHYDGATDVFLWHSWKDCADFYGWVLSNREQKYFYPKDRDRFDRFTWDRR